MDLHASAFALDNMHSPLAMQPPVLANRFIINLRSLNTAGSSQDSSARQHWSRFSAPNFHIPDSFLGNIGEDLQDGHEPADGDLDGSRETDTVRLNTASLPGAELDEISTTSGSSTSRPVDMQVSHLIYSGSTRDERTLSLRLLPWTASQAPEDVLTTRR